MAFTHSNIIQINQEALEVAFKHHQGQTPDQRDLQKLEAYRGFGGVNPMLYDPGTTAQWVESGAKASDFQSYGPVNLFHNFLHEFLPPDQYALAIRSLRESIATAFYTPDFLPQSIYSVLHQCDLFPTKVLDPCAGNGIFFKSIFGKFPSIKNVTAVEKDLLTGFVLKAIATGWSKPSNVVVSGFEEYKPSRDNTFNLVVGNIPFGNVSVFDPDFIKGALTDRIHNYFFAKGLMHLEEGGLLIYLTTENFLNSTNNEQVRTHVFSQSNFVAGVVLPNNLMTANSGTSVGTHLLILQKDSRKTDLSPEERLLCTTILKENDFGKYPTNAYFDVHPELYIGTVRKPGKNLYGEATDVLLHPGNVTEIANDLEFYLRRQVEDNVLRMAWSRSGKLLAGATNIEGKKKLELIPAPEDKGSVATLQLDLFGEASGLDHLSIQGYLSDKDRSVVEASSLGIVASIKSDSFPDRDCVLILRGRTKGRQLYLYKIFSNIKDLKVNPSWQIGSQILKSIHSVKSELGKYEDTFIVAGDPTFENALGTVHQSTPAIVSIPHYHKDGTLIPHNNNFGLLTNVDYSQNKAEVSPLLLPDADKALLLHYCEVRDLYHELFHYENNSVVRNDALRTKLNAAYDGFVERYGYMNEPDNRKQISRDNGLGFMTLAGIEKKDQSGWLKGDLLIDPIAPDLKPRPTLENPVEALSVSLQEFGFVNIEFIAESCNADRDYCIQTLQGKIYKIPFSDNWETAARYLSGNVVQKLRDAEQAVAANPTDHYLQASLQAISLVQPEFIPFEILEFNFGERWIPCHYYEQFVTEVFDVETKVLYVKSADSFLVVPNNTNARITEEYAIETTDGHVMNGQKLMEHALENTVPRFTKTVEVNGESKAVPDHEANVLAAQKVESLREEFISWMGRLSVERKAEIETIYNNTYNTNVLRSYDGSHLNFPGLSMANLQIGEVRDSQRDAVWRIIQEQGGLIDHEMGLGKTLIAIIASYEMKRLGLVNKPLIIGLKDTVPLIAETYRRAYPNARLLYPGKNDFTPKKRQHIFQQIKYHDWDCIILTHDQFLKIEQSLHVQRDTLQAELTSLDLDLQLLKSHGEAISKKMMKGLILRKKNLEVHLSRINLKMNNRRDQDVDFGEMGIGHIFIDESHHFKNLLFTTRHTRVSGLGSPDGSQKSLNLLYAIRTLQNRYNKDLCVTFLSGTPISNSLTELYLIFKYLRPRELERSHISNFDGWASVFARKTTDYEFSVTGQIKAKERFRHFIKVPELARIYNEIADYRTAAHIKLDRPELMEKLVHIPPTPDQGAFILRLMKFAETGDGTLVGLRKLSRQEDSARMLLATNLAQKMSVDMRLINPVIYDDHPGNKINTAANYIARIYHKTAIHLGTQLVFCDIGTPKSDEFNVYDQLKNVLVTRHNIKADEISFVHDWPDSKKLMYERKVNDGQIRIVIGSTPKLGTGRNVQQRLVAVHHLDIPWRPTDLDQRNGRIRRPGNLIARKYYNNKVYSFIYAVEKSLDAYKFNLLKNKITFITQMKNAELHVRSIDEGALDEQSGVSYAEYVAILSGDTTLLEKAKLDKKILQLQTLRTAFNREVSNSRFTLTYEREAEKRLLQRISGYKVDHELYERNQIHDRQGNRQNNIELDNGLVDPEAIGKYLFQLFERFSPEKHVHGELKIGRQCGFELFIREGPEIPGIASIGSTGKAFFVQSPLTHFRYIYNRGKVDDYSFKSNARHFLFALDRIRELWTRDENELKMVQDKVATLEKMIARPFEFDSELIELKNRVVELNKIIAENIEAKNNTLTKEVESEEVIDATIQQVPETTTLQIADAKNTEGRLVKLPSLKQREFTSKSADQLKSKNK